MAGTNIAKYSFAQLEDLWKSVGGNATAAPMAAAIALAESGGRPNASNSNGNGTIDRGLWQINSIHGSLSTFDPIANAKAAVQISNNGTTWRPWCTAWSNGHCGGSYLGAGAPYQQFLSGQNVNTGTDPASVDQTATAATPVSDPFGIQGAINNFIRAIGVTVLYLTMTIIGVLLIAAGVYLMARESQAFGTLRYNVNDLTKQGRKVNDALG